MRVTLSCLFALTALGSECECVLPCSEVSGKWLVAASILRLPLTSSPAASPSHSNGLWSIHVSAGLIVS